MKKISILFLILVFLVPNMLYALPHSTCYTLRWNANTETDLDGYKVYWSNSPDIATFEDGNSTDVGNVTSYSLDLIAIGSYLRITAYDFSGNESGFSNYRYFDPDEYDRDAPLSPDIPWIEKNVCMSDMTNDGKVRMDDYFLFMKTFIDEYGRFDCIAEVS